MSAVKPWLVVGVWASLKEGLRLICPSLSHLTSQATLIITITHTQDTYFQRTAGIGTIPSVTVCTCEWSCVIVLSSVMCEFVCRDVCVCEYCKWHSVCVRERERMPAVSGIFSLEPTDEFSTAAGGITTLLYTGHSLSPSVKVYGSESPGVVWLGILWIIYIVCACLYVCVSLNEAKKDGSK